MEITASMGLGKKCFQDKNLFVLAINEYFFLRVHIFSCTKLISKKLYMLYCSVHPFAHMHMRIQVISPATLWSRQRFINQSHLFLNVNIMKTGWFSLIICCSTVQLFSTFVLLSKHQEQHCQVLTSVFWMWGHVLFFCLSQKDSEAFNCDEFHWAFNKPLCTF